MSDLLDPSAEGNTFQPAFTGLQQSYDPEISSWHAAFQDPENNGGKTPDAIVASKTDENPQDFRDLSLNINGLAYITGKPSGEVGLDYEQAKQEFVKRQGWDMPKTEAQFRGMLGGHIENQFNRHEAVNELFGDTVMKALEDTDYGNHRGIADFPTDLTSVWKQKHAPLIPDQKERDTFDAQSRSVYLKTIKDVAPIRQEIATSLKVLNDFTTGKAGDEDIQKLGAMFKDMPADKMDKILSYVQVASSREKLDKKVAKGFFQNLGESISRGADFAGDMMSQPDLLAMDTIQNNIKAGNDIYLRKDQFIRGKADNDLNRAVEAYSFNNTERGDFGDSATFAKATPEQVAALKSEIDNKIKSAKVATKLKQFAQTSIDPITPLSKAGTWAGTLEQMAYDVGSSIAPMGAVALNPVLGFKAYQTMHFNDLLVKNQDKDLQHLNTIAGVEGALEAIGDMLEIRVLKGVMPKLIDNYVKKFGNKVVRAVLRAAEAVGFEYAVETGQDAIPAAVEGAANAVGDEINQTGTWEDFDVFDARRFWAIAFLGGVGAGVATFRDLKDPRRQLNRSIMGYNGVHGSKAEYVLAAESAEDADARWQEVYNERTAADIAKGEELLVKDSIKAQEKNGTNDTYTAERNAAGEVEWVVSDSTGKEVGRVADEEAARNLISDRVQAKLVSEENTVNDLIDWWKSQDSTNTATIEAPKTVQQELDRMQGIGDTEGIKNLHERIAFAVQAGDIAPDADLNKVNILGGAKLETTAEGVFRGVISLAENAKPEDAFEEINHVFVKKALAEGRVTMPQLQSWIAQTEQATGQTYARDNETDVIENIAKIGWDYAAGRIDESAMPASFVDYVKRMLSVLKEVMVRALKLKDAFATGKIDQDFESFLAESVGLDPQIMFEKESDRVAEEIASDVGNTAYALRVAAAPVRTDKLKEMSTPEMKKRENSAKYEHLQQVTNDVAEAFGVKILNRKPQIGGWTENGNTSTEVPEHVVFDTDDMEVAKEMAAIIGATAPQLQNSTMIWREHDSGKDYELQFKAKSAKTAMEIASGLEEAGIQGFSYDPKTRAFSLVIPAMSEETKQEVHNYVQEHIKRGNIPTRGGIEARSGTAEFPSEGDYRRTLQDARNRANKIGGEQGDKILAVVERAERRIEKYEDAKKTASLAQKILSKLKTPFTSTTQILKDLDGRQFENIRELAKYLDARFAEHHGFGMFKIRSEEGRRAAAAALVHDILTGLSTDGSGHGWYGERVRETLHELQKIHPEFANDPEAQAVYIGILASTSQGYTVTENFKQAEKVFAEWKKTGRIPDHFEFAKSNEPINANLKFMQDFIDEHGMQKFMDFMDSEITGEQLRDEYGLKADGVTLKDTARGSSVLGPKIGSFFNNLRGRFDTITMDLWYTRSMHRYLGETTEPMDSPRMQELITRFREKLKTSPRTYNVDVEAAMNDDEETVKAATQIMQRWARGDNEYTDKTFHKFDDGYEIEKAARDITVDGSMKGAPQNKSFRNYFADIVLDAKAQLEKLGIPLSEADMQAIVWYAEKNLFGKVGVANEAAKPADYLDAAMQTRKRYAEGEISYSIRDGSKEGIGININDGEQDFTDQILRGEKTIETRNSRSLDPYIGKRVGLVSTGKGKAQHVGFAVIGEPKFYSDAESFRQDENKHLVPVGSEYDIPAAGKWGYPINEVEKIKPRDVLGTGIVGRKVAFSIRARDEAYDAAVKGGGIDAFKGKLQSAVDSLPDPIEGKVDFDYEKGSVEGLVEGFFMPAFSKLGAFVDWHNAATGSQYITIKIPTENETYKDAVENGGDLEEHKITIRDHNVSPFRAKEFGSPTKVIQVDDFNTKENVLHAATRLSDHLSDILEPYREYLAEKANSDAIADTGVAGIKTPTEGEADKSSITREGQVRGSALTNENQTESSPDGKLFSIRSQEQIDSVAQAMMQSQMFPEGNLAIYERAKLRFASVLEKNRDVLLGMEASGASALKIRNEKLKQALIELDGILKTLPYEVRGRVGGMSVLANIGTGDKALAGFFKKRVEMLDKELEKYLSKEYDDATYKFLKTTLPKKREAGEKPKGIGADLHAMFAVVREAMGWSEGEVNAHIAKIDYRIDNENLTPEEEARLTREADLVSSVGDWKNKTSTQKGFALKQLITTWSRGYQKFLTQKVVEKQERDADRAAAITNTGKDGLLVERQRENIKQNGKLGILKKSYFNLTSWDQFVSVLFGEKSDTATFLADGERHASNTKEDRTQAKLDEVADLFTRLASTRLAGEQLRWEMSQKSIAPFQGTPWTGLEFSQLEALSATMLWMQEDGKRHMIGKLDDNGNPISAWHYNQDFVDTLEKSLSKEAKQVRAFLLDKYEKGYDDINKVYTDLNGVNLPQIKNYSPVTVAPINAPKGMSNDPVTGAVVSGMSSSPSALRTRGTSISEPNFRDVLQTYLAHTRQMEHWMAYAPFMHQANGILRNRDVQNAIEAKGGEEARRMLNLHLDIMDKGGVREAAAQLGLNQTLSKIGGRAAQIALVGRISTILLQSTQLGASLAEMPTGAYILRMSKLLSGNLGWGEALKSPYIQRRLNEMPPIVRQAMEGLQSDRPNILKHTVEKLGRIISGADALFTAGTYAMVYDYHFKQAKEMGIPSPEEYAHRTAERAVDKLAQPTRMGARSIFENTQTGPFAKLGWAFASESRKNMALAAYNTMEKPAGTKVRTLFSLLVLNALVGTLIRNAWKDAKDDDDNELFDEKHWSPKRLTLAWFTDPLQGFPIVGDAVKAAAYTAFGEYLPSDNLFSMNSAAGIFSEKHLRNVGQLMDGNGDWEMALKDLDHLVSGMGMWNANIAAVSSLTHLAADMFGLTKNTAKAVNE